MHSGDATSYKSVERKEIMKREFLKGLGLEQTAVDAIIDEYGSSVERLKDQISNLTRERNEARESLKQFDGVDIEALKQGAEDIKAEYEGKIKDMKISGAIEKALVGAKAKHTDLLVSKFDKGKIEIDKDGNFKGIEEQLNGFKETYKDLFIPEVSGKDPSNPDGAGNSNAFDFGFMGVRTNKE